MSRTGTGTRRLDQILQDPNANWSEIRMAIKASSQGCTNVGVMRAIAATTTNDDVNDGGTGPTNHAHGHGNSSGMQSLQQEKHISLNDWREQQHQNEHHQNNEQQQEQEEEQFEILVETIHLPEFPDDDHSNNNNNNKPTSRSHLRKSSSRSITSCTSLAQSVNLMDFGVDHLNGMDDSLEDSEADIGGRSSFSMEEFLQQNDDDDNDDDDDDDNDGDDGGDKTTNNAIATARRSGATRKHNTKDTGGEGNAAHMLDSSFVSNASSFASNGFLGWSHSREEAESGDIMSGGDGGDGIVVGEIKQQQQQQQQQRRQRSRQRMERQTSVNRSDSTTTSGYSNASSNGFLGWSSYTSNRSVGTTDTSDYSNVDEAGFLNWDHSRKKKKKKKNKKNDKDKEGGSSLQLQQKQNHQRGNSKGSKGSMNIHEELNNIFHEMGVDNSDIEEDDNRDNDNDNDQHGNDGNAGLPPTHKMNNSATNTAAQKQHQHRQQHSNPSTQQKKTQKINGNNDNNDNDQPFIIQQQEQWKIEDYENPEDNAILPPTRLHRESSSSSAGGTPSLNFFKRRSSAPEKYNPNAHAVETNNHRCDSFWKRAMLKNCQELNANGADGGNATGSTVRNNNSIHSNNHHHHHGVGAAVGSGGMGDTNATNAAAAGAVNMDAIKQALLNVRKVASTNNTMNMDANDGTINGNVSLKIFNRRSSFDSSPAAYSANDHHHNHHGGKAGRPNRRQTVIGLPPFLGGGAKHPSSKATSDDEKQPAKKNETNATTTTNTNTTNASSSPNPNTHTHACFKIADKKERPQMTRRQSIISNINPFHHGVSKPSNNDDDDSSQSSSSDEDVECGHVWAPPPCEQAYSSHNIATAHSNNANILINRKDGDMDIEEECRKLYYSSETNNSDHHHNNHATNNGFDSDSSQKQRRQGGATNGAPGFLRRASFFGGERPNMKMFAQGSKRHSTGDDDGKEDFFGVSARW